ncbi:MAG: hypothetical protein ACLGG2_00520 [Gammaproteobacteria bacterium]
MTRSFRLVCATGVLLAAVAAHVPAAVAASDDPGRLFYTPAERAQLEQARAQAHASSEQRGRSRLGSAAL